MDYLPILIFVIIALILSAIMVAIPAIFSNYNSSKEKLDSYECGFGSFEWGKSSFDIRFYLVSMLFIIFDLEIAFLFPWGVLVKKMGLFGFTSMMFFLFLLTVGFVYEWKKGALEWN
ncbi:MAG: NADH-quinone oxidoreductase subunit A [Rickettsiaceae bacterium H1]|nr:NADH-quinone oxidoreductase subunit A [Rickettsiaceae bacterium H1]